MRLWSCAACMVLTVLCAAEARAHQGDRVIPIRELTDANLVEIDIRDGSVADWEAILGEPTLTPADFATGVLAYDPADLDYRVWLGWHRATGRIFAAMERVDDVYVNQYRAGTVTGSFTHNDSSIRLSIDGDHSGDPIYYTIDECCNSFDEWWELADRGVQVYEAIAEVPEGNQVMMTFSSGTDWYVEPPYAEGGGGVFGENPVVSVTEFYITPFDLLDKDDAAASRVSRLAPGQTIGLRMFIIDFDEADRLSNGGTSITLSPRAVHFLPVVDQPTGDGDSAAHFADALLIGFDGEGETSAVRDISWARIKAAFGD